MRNYVKLTPLLLIFACSPYDKGERHFKNGDYEEARIELSNISKKDQQFDKAQSLLKEIDSIEAVNQVELAKSAFEEGRYQDARALFQNIKDASAVQRNSLLAHRIDSAQSIRDKALQKELSKPQRKNTEDPKYSLSEQFGQQVAERILRNEYWIGMTKAMAIASLGQPERINRTATAAGTTEQWVYSNPRIYLYFGIDGALETYQDTK